MRILLIDNNIDAIDGMRAEIEKHFIVDVAHNGVEGTYLSQVNDYAAIVVDSDLPDINSSSVCKIARTADVTAPIIVTTSSCDTAQDVEALDYGADTIVRKPLKLEILIAHIKALIRRTYFFVEAPKINLGTLSVDLRNKEVFKNGKRIDLRRKEFDILELLVLNKNRVVSKTCLLEHIWEMGMEVNSNTLEVHMKHLRDKIDRPFSTKSLCTVHGFGYVLRGDK